MSCAPDHYHCCHFFNQSVSIASYPMLSEYVAIYQYKSYNTGVIHRLLLDLCAYIFLLNEFEYAIFYFHCFYSLLQLPVMTVIGIM